MDCKLAQQKIALYAYGELPDDQCHLLEGHLQACKQCQEEFGAVQALQQAMSLAPVEEPSANLLAQARLQLEEALDSMPRSGWLMRVQQSIFRGVSVMGRAPVAASALLVLGLGTGGWAGYHSALRNHLPVAAMTASLDGSSIASVSSVVRKPNSENVEVRYNRLVPEVAEGSLDQPEIRELLLAGAQSQLNPGVAENALSLIAHECEAGHQCAEGPLRRELLQALRYDKDSGVRLQALNALNLYVAEDERVRDGVLEALMNDKDAAIRTRAIQVLQQVEADSSVREVVHTVEAQDDSPVIRNVSRKFLDVSTRIQ
jgi:Putative zinc-finger